MAMQTIEADYIFQQIEGELGDSDFYKMIHLTRYMEDSEFATLSHPDVHDYFESLSNPIDGREAGLFVAKQRQLGRVVGMAGVYVSEVEGSPAAEVIQLVVNPAVQRAAQLGERLVGQVIEWADTHNIHEVHASISRLSGQVSQLLPHLQARSAESSGPQLVLK